MSRVGMKKKRISRFAWDDEPFAYRSGCSKRAPWHSNRARRENFAGVSRCGGGVRLYFASRRGRIAARGKSELGARRIELGKRDV
jgi:hypothetical protein